MFKRTLGLVEKNSVPASHILCYHYTSLAAAQVFAKRGLPAWDNDVKPRPGEAAYRGHDGLTAKG